MKKYLYIGLGNPGSKFDGTRHNFGIRALRAWVQHAKPQADVVVEWHTVTKFEASVANVTIGENNITCLFPLTFMNKSGEAARHFLRKRLSHLWHPPASLEHTLIIHDDIETPLGQIRRRAHGGSARGHNGVRSIHQALGTQDVPRLLLGIGPKTKTASDFVLEKFTPAEEEVISRLMPGVFAVLDSPHNPTDEQGTGA